MAEKLTPQQRQAVENRGGKLLVSAAAGSGKTKVLVDRLLGYLKDPRRDLVPVLRFIEKHMASVRQENAWGFDLPYLLTGLQNSHPAAAIRFAEENRRDYEAFYRELQGKK